MKRLNGSGGVRRWLAALALVVVVGSGAMSLAAGPFYDEVASLSGVASGDIDMDEHDILNANAINGGLSGLSLAATGGIIMANTTTFNGNLNAQWGYYYDSNSIASLGSAVTAAHGQGTGHIGVGNSLQIDGLLYSESGVIHFAETTSPTPIANFGALRTGSDNILYFTDGGGTEHAVGGDVPGWRSYTHPETQAGTQYLAGFYVASAADVNMDDVATTTTIGTAGNSHAAHAFIVAGGAGSVDAGTVSIVVSGTSINDQGVRTTSDSETLVADITALALDQYVETTRKWLGVATYTLTPSGAATFGVDVNTGMAKYDDFGNRDFTLTDIEAVVHANANETALDVILYHHNTSGWAYHATAFVPGGTVIASLATDHSTDDDLASGNYGAWKRDNLNTFVDGSDGEGFVVRVDTAVNNSVHHINLHVGANF